jgi:hypothetical protein
MGSSTASTGSGTVTSQTRGVAKGSLSTLWCRSRRTATLADATRARIYTLRDMLHLYREVMMLMIVQHMAELKKSTRLRDLKIEC